MEGNRDDESRQRQGWMGSSAQTHHMSQPRGQGPTAAKLQCMDCLAEGPFIDGWGSCTDKLGPATTAERTGQRKIRGSLQGTAALLADGWSDQPKGRGAPFAE